MNKRKLEDLTDQTNSHYIFLTKEEACDIFTFFCEYMGGEIYITNNEVTFNLRQLLENSDQRLLPGQYSLYMWGPQGSSLWIRNNQNIFEFHEYNDQDIYANPQDKYFNAFKLGYEERIFDNQKIIHYNKN